jgi:hypothetical protein
LLLEPSSLLFGQLKHYLVSEALLKASRFDYSIGLRF